MSARSHAESAAHFGCAARAAATARSTSLELALGASAIVSPVTGDTIARDRSPVPSTHWPSMKFSSVRTVTATRLLPLRLLRECTTPANARATASTHDRMDGRRVQRTFPNTGASDSSFVAALLGVSGEDPFADPQWHRAESRPRPSAGLLLVSPLPLA